MADMFGMMKEGQVVGDYIRAGQEMPHKHSDSDRKLREEAGAEAHMLHGCPNCNKHVWEEKDKGNDCPIAGCTGKRRNAKVCFSLACLTSIMNFNK